ncbi:hypothetical protein [Noviherbaspirillum malthae]|uniref:hypothetical protein n=1 Tax=Noviherbaspirillum malthae TaxID=1260987 RepID=UPI00188F6B89|nr:hypothetical protein [Noviherbaspirillum malthae]
MRTLALIGLLVIATTGCSNMREMYSGSSSTAYSGSAGRSGMDARGFEPVMNDTVINPRTGQLTLYHGG